jgi:hypothetical protein
MTSRPASESSLQDGENPPGDGNTIAAREDADMAVWFMCWLRCPPYEEFTLFPAEIATDAGRLGTPINDRRNNVLRTRGRAHPLKYGGAIH